MGRDGRRRQLAIWPRSQAPEIRRELATSEMGGVDLAAGEALASRIRTLGDTPLAVITAGREENFPRTPARLGRALNGCGTGCRTSSPGYPTTACTSSRLAAITTSPRHTTASRPSSSARFTRSSAPPATTRVFRRAGVCSADPTFAVVARTDGREAPRSASVAIRTNALALFACKRKSGHYRHVLASASVSSSYSASPKTVIPP